MVMKITSEPSFIVVYEFDFGSINDQIDFKEWLDLQLDNINKLRSKDKFKPITYRIISQGKKA